MAHLGHPSGFGLDSPPLACRDHRWWHDADDQDTGDQALV